MKSRPCSRTLNLKLQFFLGRHIWQEFCRKHLLALRHNRVLDLSLINLCSKQYPNCRIISLWLLERIIHSPIGVHLSNITARETRRLKVYKNETLEDIVIEYKIYVFLGRLCRYAHLPSNKRKALAKFKQERFDIVQNALLDFLLFAAQILSQIQKLGDNGVSENLIRRNLYGRLIPKLFSLYLMRTNSFIRMIAYLTLRFTRTQISFGCLPQIEFTCLWIANPHNRTMMRPAQFDTQCVSNCFFTWVSLIKQTTIAKLRLRKPLAKSSSQFA